MRIVVVAVGTHGDVEPHAALCQGLLRAGYDARLCVPEDFAFSLAARKIPFDPIPIDIRRICESDRGAALLASGSNGPRFLLALWRLAREIAPRAMEAIRASCQRADAVCYSPLGFAALFFARESGKPAFATCLQPLGRTRAHAHPLFPFSPRMPGVVNGLSYRVVEQAFWQIARPLLQPWVRARLPLAMPFDEIYENSSRILFGYSPAVLPQPEDWKPWMHATGYWSDEAAAYREPPDGLAEFLKEGPAVAIGFGSMHGPRLLKTMDTAIHAVAGSGRRAVIMTGWSGYAGSDALGSNFFVTDAVPHRWLFPRVAAAVHHGGAGTTAAALHAGIPSVILPCFFDQGFWGNWLARQGLGPLPIAFRRLSADTLADALDEAEEDSHMRRRLRALRTQLRREDGVRTAVRIITEALEKGVDEATHPHGGSLRRPFTGQR